MNIPLTKPYFDKKEEKAVVNVLRSGWVTQGPKVEEFENSISKYTGAKYATVVSSATAGLFLSLHSLGVSPGDEVIVPSFSFIACTNVIVHLGAKPVFVDIDPKTYNLSPVLVEKKITKKTKAIIAVDQIGLPCDIEAILKIAKKNNTHVVEDGACAIGSKINGRMVGSLGHLTVFSFHPRKSITTGDGGAIVTNNKSLDKNLKMLRQHGMSVSDVKRHKSNKVIKESYPIVGFNFRMTDLQAAVGIEQMKKLNEILEKRKSLAKRYNDAFKDKRNIIPPFVPPRYTHNYQSYMIRIHTKKISVSALRQRLLNAGISTRFGIMSSHLEKAYTKMMGKISLPETEKATKETIILPLYYNMTEKEQEFVISEILKAV